MDEATDVVVVGAGVAGGALATVLARHGVGVTVLEREAVHRDRVRGEYIVPWGVAEAKRLGLLDTLVGCGGTTITHAIGYDETVRARSAEARPLALSDLRPDVDGGLAVGHPQACTALAEAAEEAGATVVRGVRDVDVKPGREPVVRYEHDGEARELRCRMVVGADGRASGVRRQLGLELVETEPHTMGAGLLVDGLDAWPTHAMSKGTEGDVLFFVFPRTGGIARLYLLFDPDNRSRFTGPDRARDFLDAFRLDCLPPGEAIAASHPAGPLASYPMTDAWTDGPPLVDGVVLVGDAAGWSDPILGQGLSIALRDARLVSEALIGADDWSPATFDEYVTERAERMRRLRVVARVDNALNCTFTPEGRARRKAVKMATLRDPLIAGVTAIPIFVGPEAPPPEAFEPDNVTRILAFT
ncbi:MAG: FAD-dependent monooxygenase [Actinomycetota bacterium]|nr:FAD-dependent monooxygenase [Actinomycetota bacterium]